MMTNYLTDDLQIQIKENSDRICAYRTIDSEIETIKKLRDNLDSALTKALDILCNTKGKIVLTGMGKSGHIARKIAASFASTGSPSFFVHPAEASHGDLGMLSEDDVVIAISNSGESKELVDILNYCKRFGIKLITITKNFKSSLGNAGDVVLLLPDNGEACPLGLAPTNSTTATLVLGDILTAGLIHRKGFTKEEFNQRHPGGKLGSILQRVSDLMHVDEEMPILNQNSNMQQVLLEMTSKRLGCVGFVNDDNIFTGMLTDGDLRRCLNPEILNKTAKELMTQTPITISKNCMASEAMKIMHDKKITNIFVIEKNIPVGVIHIHDLLNNGVA